MKKILITGGNGFVGQALQNVLKFKPVEVINPGDIDSIDLCKWEMVNQLPKSEIIVHLASRNFVPDSFKKPLDFYNNNIQSTLNILEKAKIDGSKVIFFSTYAYGTPSYLPIDENHPVSAKNPYTQSKLICENLCESYYRDFGVPVTIFRPFNIYGPRQNPSFLIPTIIRQVKNKTIHLNDSRPKRDYIYIDDVVKAVVLAIENEPHVFNIYNLGTGESSSVKEIVNMIVNLTHSKSHITYSDQIRNGEIFDTIADIKKIKKELNWEPTIPLSQGLKMIVEEHVYH